MLKTLANNMEDLEIIGCSRDAQGQGKGHLSDLGPQAWQGHAKHTIGKVFVGRMLSNVWQGPGTLCPHNILKLPASSWGAIMGNGNLPDLLLAITF